MVVLALQPPREQPAGGSVRGELDEGEAAPHRRVHEGDRTVGGVHRPDHEEVGRQREVVPGVREPHGLRPVLQEEVQLTEDLRQVGAVDLVDDQEVRDVPVALAGGQRRAPAAARRCSRKATRASGSSPGRYPSKKSS